MQRRGPTASPSAAAPRAAPTSSGSAGLRRRSRMIQRETGTCGPLTSSRSRGQALVVGRSKALTAEWQQQATTDNFTNEPSQSGGGPILLATCDRHAKERQLDE